MSQTRRMIGRPPRAIPILKSQPAIYRFFGPLSATPTVSASSASDLLERDPDSVSDRSSDEEIVIKKNTRRKYRVLDSSEDNLNGYWIIRHHEIN